MLLTLKKIWSYSPTTPNETSIVLNTKKSDISKNSLCRHGHRIIDTFPLVTIELYQEIKELIRQGVAVITDTQLIAKICIRMNIFDEHCLNETLRSCQLKREYMSNESSVFEKQRPDLLELATILSKSDKVSPDYVNSLTEEYAIRQVLINSMDGEHFSEKERNAHDLLNNIINIFNELCYLEYFIVLNSVCGSNNTYYLPHKLAIITCTNVDKFEDRISETYEKLSDCFQSEENPDYKIHAMHSDDVVDFNLIMPTSGGISLTQECQLRCDYCSFSSGGDDCQTLSQSKIEAFINMLARNVIKKRLVNKKDEKLSIIIAGGGEPTFKWQTFVDTVEYIKQISQRNNIQYSLNITTNGCHSKEQTEYIINNFETITVSFDGLPELQNKNRKFSNGAKSFDVVNQTIKRLDEAHANYSILSVVQHEDFDRLREMAAFVFENYPNVRAWVSRPTIAVGRAVDNRVYQAPASGSYAKAYLSSAASLGYPRKMFSGIFSTRTSEIFCGALYGKNPWLVPNGSIVTCQDAHDKAVVVGEFLEDDTIALKRTCDMYAKISFDNMKLCQNCIAYHFCCGDCPLKNNSYDMKLYSAWKCNEIKEYWNQMLEQVMLNGSCDGWFVQKIDMNINSVTAYKLRRH